jgi:hypothetical protein
MIDLQTSVTDFHATRTGKVAGSINFVSGLIVEAEKSVSDVSRFEKVDCGSIMDARGSEKVGQNGSEKSEDR